MYLVYVLKRILYGMLLYAVMIFTFSLIFNNVLDMTMRSQIEETVKADVQREVRSRPTLKEDDILRLIEEKRRRKIEQYSLDRPYFERVLNKTWQTLSFNLGNSLSIKAGSQTNDVNTIISEKIPNTILLFSTEIVLVVFFGVAMGIKAARKPNGLLDRATSLIAMITNGLPTWWLGMLFIMIFSFSLPVFPSGGIHSVPPPEGFGFFLDMLWHMALPLFTLVLLGVWGTAYLVRNIVLGTLQEDFIMTARARGIPERKILFGHTLRTAMPAIVTLSVISLFSSIGGNLVFEGIFQWPGMGNLYWTAIEQNDIPVLMGNLSVTTLFNVVGFVLLDVIYGFLDPRIKVGGKA